jgi:hypothetical protein
MIRSFVAAATALLLSTPAVAGNTLTVFSGLDWRSGQGWMDAEVIVAGANGNVRGDITSAGNPYAWMPLTHAPGKRLVSVEVCYLPVDASAGIDAVQLVRSSIPGSDRVVFSSQRRLDAAGGECASFSLGNGRVGDGLFLRLTLDGAVRLGAVTLTQR